MRMNKALRMKTMDALVSSWLASVHVSYTGFDVSHNGYDISIKILQLYM
jgi:hypothetical protein